MKNQLAAQTSSTYPKWSFAAERASIAALLHSASPGLRPVLHKYSEFHDNRGPLHHDHYRVDKPTLQRMSAANVLSKQTLGDNVRASDGQQIFPYVRTLFKNVN